MSGAENLLLDTNVIVYAFDHSEAVKGPSQPFRRRFRPQHPPHAVRLATAAPPVCGRPTRPSAATATAPASPTTTTADSRRAPRASRPASSAPPPVGRCPRGRALAGAQRDAAEGAAVPVGPEARRGPGGQMGTPAGRAGGLRGGRRIRVKGIKARRERQKTSPRQVVACRKQPFRSQREAVRATPRWRRRPLSFSRASCRRPVADGNR